VTEPAPSNVPRSAVERARAVALHTMDVVPGLRRTLGDLSRVEMFDRSVVMAAQALLGLVPLLILLVAFLPSDVADVIVERFEDATGVSTGPSVSPEITSEQIRAAAGWMGLLVALLSATSFAGAVQRLFEHVWQCEHIAGLRARMRGLLWFIGWIAFLQASSLVERVLSVLLASPLLEVVTQTLMATLIWWGTASVLLFRRVGGLLLLPGALLAGISTAIYSLSSSIWMPRYVVVNLDQFGTLGLVLAVATWLIGFSLLVALSAVIGHVVATEQRTGHWVARSWWARPKSRRAVQPR
jgi:membrane protein